MYVVGCCCCSHCRTFHSEAHVTIVSLKLFKRFLNTAIMFNYLSLCDLIVALRCNIFCVRMSVANHCIWNAVFLNVVQRTSNKYVKHLDNFMFLLYFIYCRWIILSAWMLKSFYSIKSTAKYAISCFDRLWFLLNDHQSIYY